MGVICGLNLFLHVFQSLAILSIISGKSGKRILDDQFRYATLQLSCTYVRACGNRVI